MSVVNTKIVNSYNSSNTNFNVYRDSETQMLYMTYSVGDEEYIININDLKKYFEGINMIIDFANMDSKSGFKGFVLNDDEKSTKFIEKLNSILNDLKKKEEIKALQKKFIIKKSKK